MEGLNVPLKPLTRMRYAYSSTLTDAELDVSKKLAKFIYESALTQLEDDIKNRRTDVVSICVSKENILRDYLVNENIVVPYAIKREIINLAEEDKMRVCTTTAENLYLSY